MALELNFYEAKMNTLPLVLKSQIALHLDKFLTAFRISKGWAKVSTHDYFWNNRLKQDFHDAAPRDDKYTF